MLAVGICGFALFFLSDANDLHWGRRELRWCFPLGAVLLTAATAAECLAGQPPVGGWTRAAAALGTLLFLLLEVYALFFALPPKASYGAPGQSRSTRVTGLYALCRHPGVLFFIPLYAGLWLTFGLSPVSGGVYALLDVLLVVYEDRWVFPAVLEGYADYQRQVPFLLPHARSVRNCLAGPRRESEKE